MKDSKRIHIGHFILVFQFDKKITLLSLMILIIMIRFFKGYKNFVEYHTHNVDSATQAYGLSSVWLFWANSISSVWGE